MEISKKQQNIAEMLKLCGVEGEIILAILCVLETEEQQQAMLNYLQQMEVLEEPMKLLKAALEILME